MRSHVCNIVGKKIESLREALGSPPTLAMAGMPSIPGSLLKIKEAVEVAARKGVNTITLDFRAAEDIEPAFETIKGRAAALYVSTDPFILSNVDQIDKLALRAGLPTSTMARSICSPADRSPMVPIIPTYSGRPPGWSARLQNQRIFLSSTYPVRLRGQQDSQGLGLTLSPSNSRAANEVIE